VRYDVSSSVDGGGFLVASLEVGVAMAASQEGSSPARGFRYGKDASYCRFDLNVDTFSPAPAPAVVVAVASKISCPALDRSV
jgi:hypothetical protein